jgi:hypothetical protein
MGGAAANTGAAAGYYEDLSCEQVRPENGLIAHSEFLKETPSVRPL